MHNVYLFQPQYSIEYEKTPTYWIPYSVGCIWSYAYQFTDIQENFKLRELIFKREDPDVVLDRIVDPKVCGFSLYVWNFEYCLHMAKLIKERWPSCVIVFGGPQVSGSLIKYDYIDSIIMGEGEESFLELLRSIADNCDPETFYNKKRLQQLEIPSPYTTGLFDQMVNDNPTALWSMTLETNRGCPFACTFCDWGSVTYSKVKKFSLDKVKEELEWAVTHRVGYIFVADANFGAFKERDLEISKLIRSAADRSQISSLNIQYAKNSTDVVFEIAKTIGPYSKGITVSVQSMHDQTLNEIKRKNLDINNISRLMKLSEEYNVKTYTEVILGLPMETKESWIRGLTDLLELGQHQNIDIWFAQLLENSEISSLESRQKYGIKSIRVENYMTLDSGNDNIKEYAEIINQTNTMSTNDIIDSYLYAWLIIHFHINGYTQIISRYARNIKQIPYRMFYDNLYNTVQQDSIIKPHFESLKETLKNYLNQGTLPKELQGGHSMHSGSYEFLYDHRHHIYNISINVLSKLTTIDPLLLNLQDMFIFNQDKTYPQSIVANYNLFTGQIKETNYKFENQINKVIDNFYLLRRKGLIKNQVTICPN